MSTLYKAVDQYCRQSKNTMLPVEERVQLGVRVYRAYIAAGGNKGIALKKVSQREGDKTFKVINYPSWFDKKMTEVISDFYKERGSLWPEKKHQCKIKPFKERHKYDPILKRKIN